MKNGFTYVAQIAHSKKIARISAISRYLIILYLYGRQKNTAEFNTGEVS